MPESPVHLIVGTPCYGGIVAGGFFTSVLYLQEACMRSGIQVTFLMPSGDALIQRARQNIATFFLSRPDATHLLFVDADIEFHPEQVFRLLRFKEDVTAALYPLKRHDWGKAKAAARSGGDPEAASLTYICEWAKPRVARDGFAKARYVGNGFLMIRRSALEKMMKAYPQLRYKSQGPAADPFPGSPYRYAFFDCLLDQAARTYLPEDYSFCRRWTDLGGDIWVDQQSKLSHIGMDIFKGDLGRRSGPTPPDAAPGKGK